MATRFRTSAANILSLALYLVDLVSEHLADFQAYEKDKKEPLFDDSFEERFRASVASLEGKAGQAQGTKQKKAKAVAAERKARAALAESLAGIREDVTIYNAKDKQVQHAFGVGREGTTSKKVLSAAAAVIASWKMPEFQAEGIAAGVTRERIDALTAQQGTLKTASTAATKARAAGKKSTAEKFMTLAEVKTTNSTIRRVARRVFAKQPDERALFLTVPLGTEEADKKDEPATATKVVVTGKKASQSTTVVETQGSATVSNGAATAGTDAAATLSVKPVASTGETAEAPKAKRKHAGSRRARTSLRTAAGIAAAMEKEAPAAPKGKKAAKAVEPKAVKAKVVKAKAVKPKAVKAKAVEPKAVKAKAVKAKAVEPEAEKPAHRANGVAKKHRAALTT